MTLRVVSDYVPAGDQPVAIQTLIKGIQDHQRDQVLLGVTGSGKTFTMAQVIAQAHRPALILAPNKTLAAQLYGEMKGFFPHNAVEYFVSYYDYYQPEAYIARSDTYIEKEATINEQIDRMRHGATRALLERPNDTIVVASVSCIYGIGDVELYSTMTLPLQVGETMALKTLITRLVELSYKRNDVDFQRGRFRVRGDILEIFPAHLSDRAWRLSFFGDGLEAIYEIDPLTGEKILSLSDIKIFPNSHYVTPKPTLAQAIKEIQKDLIQRIAELESEGKFVEAQRLQQRITFDIEMLTTTGMCHGIENYSRYLTGRAPGEPPPTLFEYLPSHALLFVDESHVTIPQLGGMYRGDAARKNALAEFGFRLPSCRDNRPLKFQEWEALRPQTIYVSATPGPWELEQTCGVFVEQIIRPTGLMDPLCVVRPTTHQVDDLIAECQTVVKAGGRILVTTLTKKMAEALAEYFEDAGLKSRYLHSDVDTLERIEIIRDLRKGVFDVLMGINLLREGLDIPECALVAILDADKEGFLRSRTSLIQTMGRAARHVNGRVVLYADTITPSMKAAMEETHRRREKQQHHNTVHGITPQSIKKNITDILSSVYEKDHVTVDIADHALTGKALEKKKKEIEKQMLKAASHLEFEEAARLRDTLRALEEKDLGL